MDCAVVLSTTPTQDEAKKIAQNLLEKKIVACVTILPRATSFFWWDEKISQSNEFVLIIKTKKALVKNIVEVITQAHSYDVPEVISFSIEEGNVDYLQWVASTCI